MDRERNGEALAETCLSLLTSDWILEWTVQQYMFYMMRSVLPRSLLVLLLLLRPFFDRREREHLPLRSVRPVVSPRRSTFSLFALLTRVPCCFQLRFFPLSFCSSSHFYHSRGYIWNPAFGHIIDRHKAGCCSLLSLFPLRRITYVLSWCYFLDVRKKIEAGTKKRILSHL